MQKCVEVKLKFVCLCIHVCVRKKLVDVYIAMLFHLFTGKGNKRKRMEGSETNKNFKNIQAADHGKNEHGTQGEGKKMTRKERKEMKIMESKNKKMKKENPNINRPQKQFPQKKKPWGQSKIKKRPGRGRRKF